MSRSLRRARRAVNVGSGASLTRRGDRVALRPLKGGDLLALESWCEAEELGGRLGEAHARALAITHRGRRWPIGVITYGVEDRWLRFEFVGLEPESRGRGLGTEALRLLEEAALAEGLASRFWAEVPRGDGLALYFWLRLGYRPAAADESSWPGGAPRDMMAMVRAPRGADVGR